jgi:hypothetical protein
MRRHRRRFLVILGLLAVLAALGYFLWPSSPGSPWENAAAVQVGDTRTQLYATLGGPPGDYRRSSSAGVRLEDHEQQIGAEMWSSDGGMVYVWLDKDDRVTRIHRLPSVQTSFLRQVRNKLGL